MIYSYHCDCGEVLDVERSIHEEAATPMCFNCHKSMNRVWSPPTIVFNGPGFYSNGG